MVMMTDVSSLAAPQEKLLTANFREMLSAPRGGPLAMPS